MENSERRGAQGQIVTLGSELRELFSALEGAMAIADGLKADFVALQIDAAINSLKDFASETKPKSAAG